MRATITALLLALLAQTPALWGQQTQPATQPTTRPAEITFLGVKDAPIAMVFIIDLEGDGFWTFDFLREEVVLAVDQMSSGQWCGISDAKGPDRRPRPRLIRADAMGKKALQDRMDSWTVGGGVDHAGSFGWARKLLDGAPDGPQTIYFVTDYPPDAETRQTLAKQKTDVRIHTFLWSSKPGDEATLKGIGADHGGQFRRVDPADVKRQQRQR